MATPNTDDCEELKFETKEIRYKWTIEDFTTNQPYMADIVESQTFPAEDLPQWCLRLRPRGEPNGSETRKFGVYLVLKKAERGEKSIVVNYNLKFLGDNGTEIDGMKVSGRKMDEDFGFGFFLTNDSNMRIPLSTLGKLIIRVTIFIRKPVKSVTFKFPIEIPKPSALEGLSELLKSGDYADFSIESVDGKVFPVHKNVLSTRNPLFFGLMFTSDTKEAGDNRVKLPFEGEIVSALLEYLYTDEVVSLTPIAARLYPVAHQYQLDRLVAICAANLSQNLAVANIFVSLRIAKKFGDVKLQSACQKFLDGHKDAAVQMIIDADFIEDSDPKSDGSRLCCLGRIPKWFEGAQ